MLIFPLNSLPITKLAFDKWLLGLIHMVQKDRDRIVKIPFICCKICLRKITYCSSGSQTV